MTKDMNNTRVSPRLPEPRKESIQNTGAVILGRKSFDMAEDVNSKIHHIADLKLHIVKL